MKITAGILLLLIVCVSCNSFRRIHYRHMKLVPASPIVHSTSETAFSIDETISQPDSVHCVVDAEALPALFCDTLVQPIVELTAADSTDVGEHTIAPAPFMNQEPESIPPARRDWSWLIALLMITGACLILLYLVFVVPGMGILLILKFIFGGVLLYIAVRMMLAGFIILKNRVLKRKTYKET